MIFEVYPESFCSENLAIRKVFAFSDSGAQSLGPSVTIVELDCCYGTNETESIPLNSTQATFNTITIPNPCLQTSLRKSRKAQHFNLFVYFSLCMYFMYLPTPQASRRYKCIKVSFAEFSAHFPPALQLAYQSWRP